MKILLNLLLILIIQISSYVSSTVLETETNRNTLGSTWGYWDECTPGTFAYGFQIKVERISRWHILRDDDGMTGMRFYCQDLESQHDNIISSKFHSDGSWTAKKYCPPHQWLVGYRLKVEGPILLDNTGANNIELECSSGLRLDGGGTKWGSFRSWKTCPKGEYFCGVQTRVRTSIRIDSVGLVTLKVRCCPYKNEDDTTITTTSTEPTSFIVHSTSESSTAFNFRSSRAITIPKVLSTADYKTTPELRTTQGITAHEPQPPQEITTSNIITVEELDTTAGLLTTVEINNKEELNTTSELTSTSDLDPFSKLSSISELRSTSELGPILELSSISELISTTELSFTSELSATTELNTTSEIITTSEFSINSDVSITNNSDISALKPQISTTPSDPLTTEVVATSDSIFLTDLNIIASNEESIDTHPNSSLHSTEQKGLSTTKSISITSDSMSTTIEAMLNKTIKLNFTNAPNAQNEREITTAGFELEDSRNIKISHNATISNLNATIAPTSGYIHDSNLSENNNTYSSTTMDSVNSGELQPDIRYPFTPAFNISTVDSTVTLQTNILFIEKSGGSTIFPYIDIDNDISKLENASIFFTHLNAYPSTSTNIPRNNTFTLTVSKENNDIANTSQTVRSRPEITFVATPLPALSIDSSVTKDSTSDNDIPPYMSFDSAFFNTKPNKTTKETDSGNAKSHTYISTTTTYTPPLTEDSTPVKDIPPYMSFDSVFLNIKPNKTTKETENGNAKPYTYISITTSYTPPLTKDSTPVKDIPPYMSFDSAFFNIKPNKTMKETDSGNAKPTTTSTTTPLFKNVHTISSVNMTITNESASSIDHDLSNRQQQNSIKFTDDKIFVLPTIDTESRSIESGNNLAWSNPSIHFPQFDQEDIFKSNISKTTPIYDNRNSISSASTNEEREDNGTSMLNRSQNIPSNDTQFLFTPVFRSDKNNTDTTNIHRNKQESWNTISEDGAQTIATHKELTPPQFIPSNDTHFVLIPIFTPEQNNTDPNNTPRNKHDSWNHKSENDSFVFTTPTKLRPSEPIPSNENHFVFIPITVADEDITKNKNIIGNKQKTINITTKYDGHINTIPNIGNDISKQEINPSSNTPPITYTSKPALGSETDITGTGDSFNGGVFSKENTNIEHDISNSIDNSRLNQGRKIRLDTKTPFNVHTNLISPRYKNTSTEIGQNNNTTEIRLDTTASKLNVTFSISNFLEENYTDNVINYLKANDKNDTNRLLNVPLTFGLFIALVISGFLIVMGRRLHNKLKRSNSFTLDSSWKYIVRKKRKSYQKSKRQITPYPAIKHVQPFAHNV